MQLFIFASGLRLRVQIVLLEQLNHWILVKNQSSVEILPAIGGEAYYKISFKPKFVDCEPLGIVELLEGFLGGRKRLELHN